MTKPLIIYDDFSGGDWGNIGAKKAAKNQFQALNLLMYEDGQMGPRAGATKLTSANNTSGPANFYRSLGRQAGGDSVWMLGTEGGNLYPWRVSSHTVTALIDGQRITPGVGVGVGPNDREGVVDIGDGSASYFTSNASLRLINWNLAFLSTPAAVALSTIAVYGDRMVAVSAPAGQESNVLRYSAPADYTSWPAVNVITVGDSSPIAGLYVVRGSLIIVKRDFEVWVLTGVPGVNETLRQVLPRVDNDEAIAVATASPGAGIERLAALWMMAMGRNGPHNLTPMLFGGSAQTRDFPHLELDCFDPYFAATSQTVEPLAHEGDVAVISPQLATATDVNMLVRYNGVWTRHLVDWPSLTSAVTGTTGRLSAVNAVHVGRDRLVVMGALSTISATDVRLFSLPFTNTIPTTGGDSWGIMKVGDDSNTPEPNYLYLSEFWHPESAHMIVRELVVEVTKAFNGGFDASVKVTGLTPAQGTPAGSQTTATNTISLTGSNGELAVRIPFEPITGRAFQVRFDNIVGCSIRRVSVLGEVDPSRA